MAEASAYLEAEARAKCREVRLASAVLAGSVKKVETEAEVWVRVGAIVKTRLRSSANGPSEDPRSRDSRGVSGAFFPFHRFKTSP